VTPAYKLALAGSGLLLLVVVGSLVWSGSPDEVEPLDEAASRAQADAGEAANADAWSADPPAEPPRRTSANAGQDASRNRIVYEDSPIEPLPEPEPVPTLDVGRSPFGQTDSIFAPSYEPVGDPTPPPSDPMVAETPVDPARDPAEVETDDPAEANRSMDVNGESDVPALRRPTVALGPTDRVAEVPGGEPVAADNGPDFAPEPPILRRYTVESGDSLSSIALATYGSGSRWVEIAQANPTIDPNRLKVGQEIKLPDLDGVGNADNAAAENNADDDLPRRGTIYTVKSGDSLSGIAQQYYSSASKWELIFQANRGVIGDNPANLKVGMELRIPPPANGAN
jgi:nucleoid-associated protein YgaU